MRIDGHQHFWRFSAAEFGWIDSPILARDFLPADLRPLLKAAGMDGCIAVQARTASAETDFLLRLAAENPWILGVIGWVDLLGADIAPLLAPWAGQTKLRGMRYVLQAEPDVPAVLAHANFRRNVSVLQDNRLVYEVLIQAHQFSGVAAFCAGMDKHFLVLDHLGKPAIALRDRDGFADWRRNLRTLAELPHVYCKLSGLVTEARIVNGALCGFSARDFYPYLDSALEFFGPGRIMFGSDWPVCLLAESYAGVHDLASLWAIENLSESERVSFWGGNLARVYGLGV